jgi:signal transduction histidine kinase
MVSRLREIIPSLTTESVSTGSHSPDLHSDEIDRLRGQLWVGLMVTTLIVLAITFTARLIMNDPTPPLSVAILGSLITIALANLYYRKTRYAHIVQGIYVFCIHLAVPPVLVLYGGTRGFGDIALLIAVILVLLYGWRRWMFVSFGIMTVTLIWVLYRDIIGDPVAPLLNYSAQFTSLKFFILTLIMIFILRYSNAFYRSLLDKYRRFADEQVRLNRELQLSRQKIVTAREEERRRLRRDLHDGLGPTLAAQMFRLGAAQELLDKNPQKTAKILDELQDGIEGTLSHIRQLVYELRPPLLDQLGLKGAITDFVSQHEAGVEINLELPEQLPSLKAAVEVAAFRIMQTGIDNVVKHARASHCDVRLTVIDGNLNIDITDDGVGIAVKYMAGVGLTSMRERAEELGGTFAIAPTKLRGTHLAVSIPLLSEPESMKDKNI